MMELKHPIISVNARTLEEAYSIISRASDLRMGRIMVFYRSLSTTDGSAAIITNGYFDACDFPPWTSWLSCGHQEARKSTEEYFGSKQYDVSFLLSWVPKEMVELVNDVIEASADRQFDWMKDCHFDLALVEMLKHLEVLGDL
ncbi:hypothetical protein HC928_11225 [bacterium]|nr:hypothetical protein [bacterium]